MVYGVGGQPEVFLQRSSTLVCLFVFGLVFILRQSLSVACILSTALGRLACGLQDSVFLHLAGAGITSVYTMSSFLCVLKCGS